MLHKEVVARWRGRRLYTITKPEIHNLLDAIVDRGSPISANRSLAVIKRLFSWSVERGIVERNVCDAITAPAPEVTRDRILSDTEIKAAWQAFAQVGYPHGQLAQILLLTGARLREATQAPWSEFDLEAKIWTIARERAKNGQAHEIPLSDGALKILASLPRVIARRDTPSFLFTFNGHAPVASFNKPKRALDAAMCETLGEAPPHWTYHDLRRTAASGMASIKVPPHIIESCLNHRSGVIRGVAAVYNRHSYSDEKREALQAWSRRLDAIVSGEAASNIVELAKARA